MNISKQEYLELTEKASRNSRWRVNTLKAFAVGGSICLIGQCLIRLYSFMGADKQDAAAWCSVTLIAASVILTALGKYEKLAKHGGAGTLVPITGFSNAVVSPAMEFRTEGFVTGTAVKMFTIAGPVIVYGVLASALYGVVLMLTGHG